MVQVSIFALLTIAYLLGYKQAASIAVGWLIHSAISILTLEYVNYIRHWGLRRDDSDKKYQTEHAWNTQSK